MENESEGHSKCNRLFIQEYFPVSAFLFGCIAYAMDQGICIACCGVCESMRDMGEYSYVFSYALHTQWMRDCCIACCGVCESMRDMGEYSYVFSYLLRKQHHVLWSVWDYESRVTYECVMLHMNESRHIWIGRVTCEWVTSHVNGSCHVSLSHVTHEWVIPHMNESCHIWRSHVTYEWVMSHMNQSRHLWMGRITCEWVTSHINWSFRIYECDPIHMGWLRSVGSITL